MKKTLVLVSISMLTLWLASGCALLWPADKNLPVIPISDITNTTLNEFNVRGYVHAILICPPRHMCVREDGVVIASEQVAPGEPDYKERTLELRTRGEITTVFIRPHLRGLLKVGREYLFSFRKGRGVVGVSAVD